MDPGGGRRGDADPDSPGDGTERIPPEWLRALAENAADVVYLRDADGVIRWASPSVTDVLGWDPRDVLGTAADDLIHPDDRDAAHRLRDLAFAGHAGEGLVVRVRTRSGGYLHMSGLIKPLLDRDGATVGVTVALRDVSDLIRAKDDARVARERMQAVFDSLLEPHMLLEAVRDDSGEIVDFRYAQANRAAVEPMGMDPVGRRVLELWPDVRGTLQVEQFAAWLSAGAPIVLDDWAYPYQLPGQERRYDIRAVRVDDSLLFAWRDVTERHRIGAALAESEARFRLLTENATDAVFELEPDGTVVWASQGAHRLTGRATEDLIGTNLIDLVAEDDRDPIADARAEAISGQQASARFRVTAADGTLRWVHGTSRPLLDERGAVVGRVVGWRDVHAEVLAEQRLERRARTDTLTGLLNRGEMLARLAGLLADSRASGAGLAVAFCDLDDFKEVNDRHGHGAGDVLLQATAARIRGCLREGDLVARMGGDEILVVLPVVHDLTQAARVAETIRDVVALPVHVDGQDVLATVSVGITIAEAGDDLDSVISRADTAMYESKRTGRNRVVPALRGDV